MRVRFISAVVSLLMLPALLTAGCGGGGSGGGSTNNGTNTPSRNVTRATTVSAVRGVRNSAILLQAFGAGGSGSRAVHITQTRQTQIREYDPNYGLWAEFVMDSESSFRTVFYHAQTGGLPVGSIAAAFTATGLSIVYDVPEGLEPSRGTLHIDMVSETSGNINGNIEDLATHERTQFNLLLQQTGNDSFGEPLYGITGSINYRNEAGGEFAFNNLVIAANGSLSARVLGGGSSGQISMNPDGSGSLTMTTGEGQTISQWDALGGGSIRFPDGNTEEIHDFDAFVVTDDGLSTPLPVQQDVKPRGSVSSGGIKAYAQKKLGG